MFNSPYLSRPHYCLDFEMGNGVERAEIMIAANMLKNLWSLHYIYPSSKTPHINYIITDLQSSAVNLVDKLATVYQHVLCYISMGLKIYFSFRSGFCTTQVRTQQPFTHQHDHALFQLLNNAIQKKKHLQHGWIFFEQCTYIYAHMFSKYY